MTLGGPVSGVPTPTLYRRNRRPNVTILASAFGIVLIAAAIWLYRIIVVPVQGFTAQIVPTPAGIVKATPTAAPGAITTTATATASLAPQPTAAPPPSTPTPAPTPLPTLSGDQRINVLLLGSDTDAKFAGAFITQIMIVATIDPVNHTVALMSIPRDFWVPIPGHGIAKIQVAYQLGENDHPNGGGVALARQTVEDDFGIHIDHYAWIGLEGFIKVIDTAGGVNIEVLHPILDDQFPDDIQANGKTTTTNIYASRRLFIPAGAQHLDGVTALEYVRSRHADLIGDFGRSERQQQVLLNLRQKLQSPATILKIPEYVNDLQGYVKTDFSISELIAFANFMRQYQSQPIQQVVLMPPTYSQLGVSNDGQDIVEPNWSAVHAEVARLFAPPASATTSVTITTSSRIIVENGTTIGGLAGRAATYLRTLGYTVDAATTASSTNQQESVVTYYDPLKSSEANLLAQSFNATVRQAPANAQRGTADIVITLGVNHGTFEGF